MTSITTVSIGLAIAAIATTAAQADTHQVQLNYNFNGIVHDGEAAQPDAPNGYRAISDRGLDFMNGVPAHEILDNYLLVDQPGALDIVHIGNRNTVDGGTWAFDDVPDGDDIGVQPDWLTDPDQTGSQSTILQTPIPVLPGTNAGIIFQVSNGGGDLEVIFKYENGRTYTLDITAPDWFGPFNGQPNIGEFPGTFFNDFGEFGETLLLTEAIVDLTDFQGETLVEITFGNQGNTRAGYAVLAVNINSATGPQLTTLGSCPGRMGFKVTGATPNKPVAFVYAFGQGNITIPNGFPCAGSKLGLNATAKLAKTQSADANGESLLDTQVPAKACGSVYMQALDINSCKPSNVVLVE